MTLTHYMSLLGGLALFLYGMQMMSEGLEAAAGNKMKEILEKLTANRFLGVLVGAVFTALLASIGTNRNARRTTIIHVSFNVIGTIVFAILCITTPLIMVVQGWTPDSAPAQIANLHTLFNVTTTCLLLPFGNWLAKFSEFVLKDKEETEDKLSVHYLKNIKHIGEENLGGSAINMEGTRKEIMRMLDMAKENVCGAFQVFSSRNEDMIAEIDGREEYIDFLNKEISKYISKAITHERTESGSKIFNSYFSMTSNIERISDHALNIAGYSKLVEERKIKFSDIALQEIGEMQKTCEEAFELLTRKNDDVISWHSDIACMEQRIDDMTKEYRNNMYARIQEGICTDEGSILFSEMLTDFERIGDHALNISDEMMKIKLITDRA